MKLQDIRPRLRLKASKLRYSEDVIGTVLHPALVQSQKHFNRISDQRTSDFSVNNLVDVYETLEYRIWNESEF